MFEDVNKIRTAAASGLTKAETEALVGHQLSDEEMTQFNKTKAALKLQAAVDKKKEEQQAKPQTLLQVGITNSLKPKLPALKDRYTKEQIETCIEAHYGVVTRICNELDCTYSQFYKAVKDMDLQTVLADSKKNLVSLAEHTLLEALQSVDEKTRVDVAKYTLSRLGKDYGWSDNNNVQVAVNVDAEQKKAQILAVFGINQDTKDDNNA